MGIEREEMISIKSEKEIKLMEDVCKIVAKFYEKFGFETMMDRAMVKAPEI